MGRKLSVALLVVAVAAGLGVWGWSLFKSDVAPVAELLREMPKGLDIDISAKGVTLSQGAAGRTSWSLSASSADYNQESGEARVADPRVTYYPDNGDPIVVEAPEGIVDRERDTIRLQPEVRVTWGEAVLTGAQMIYTGADKMIRIHAADGKQVSVERGTTRITADYLELDIQRRTVQAQRDVTMTTIAEPFQNAPTLGG